MDMKRCMNGHYYDASVNQVCPYCGQGQQGGQMQYGMGQPGMAPMGQPGMAPMGQPGMPPMGQGVNMNMGMPADSGKTLPLGAIQNSSYSVPQQSIDTGATAPVNASFGVSPVGGDNDEGKTVALIKQELGIDPVVGWLVCISGSEKGKDYRIHSDNNFIGRSERMDICIKGDETISRDNHAIISFDTKEMKYFFSPGEGRTIIRHNGNAIFQTTEISANDRISIGNTELIFIPFCTSDFTWSEE